MPAASTSSRTVTVRNAFFSGLLLVAPLVVTIWAFATIIDLVGGTFHPLFVRFLPEDLRETELLWKLIATVIVVILVTLLGYLSHYVFGKLFFEVGGRFMQGIPGVGAVYNTVKQIVDTFSTQNRNLFNKVVLIEYPRKGVWTIGFLTSKETSEVQDRIGGEVWTVFVPTTPNPTSGFLLMLPRADIVELDMSVGDGMKMVISGGAVVPPWPIDRRSRPR
ncbi:MAG TPA: DUF502 domain-containing protein [Opitutaceae bacterium]|nr:DUF502 domain-containing protein [Opitutaceae bacterium]